MVIFRFSSIRKLFRNSYDPGAAVGSADTNNGRQNGVSAGVWCGSGEGCVAEVRLRVIGLIPGASTMTRAPIVITDEEAGRRCLGGNTYRTHGIDARFASDREVAGLSARVPLKVCARRSIQGFWAHNQELGDTSLSVPLRIRPRPIFRGIA
jgi:hypothetical protein